MERHIQTMRALKRELEELEERTREVIREGKRLLAEAEGAGLKPAPARKPKTRKAKRPTR